MCTNIMLLNRFYESSIMSDDPQKWQDVAVNVSRSLMKRFRLDGRLVVVFKC